MAECKACKKRKFDPFEDMWSLHSPPLDELDGQSMGWLFCSAKCVENFAKIWTRRIKR